MTKTSRTKKRASSRAKAVCPHCGKRLHGDRGLKEHVAQVHAVPGGEQA